MKTGNAEVSYWRTDEGTKGELRGMVQGQEESVRLDGGPCTRWPK